MTVLILYRKTPDWKQKHCGIKKHWKEKKNTHGLIKAKYDRTEIDVKETDVVNYSWRMYENIRSLWSDETSTFLEHMK